MWFVVKKKFIILIMLSIFLMFSCILQAWASINVVDDPIKLYYSDGSYVTLEAGRYNSIYSLGDVWYVNGKVYPPVYSAIANSLYTGYILLAVVDVVLAAVLILMAVKNSLEASELTKIIVVVIVLNITLLIGITTIGMMQN